MRRLIRLVVIGIALVQVASAAAATTSIEIRRGGFSTRSVTINLNDAVTWKNVDTIQHQVVANGGQFASPILGRNQSYTFTFRNSGTFRYHDGLHPSLRATVVVRGAPPQVTLAASAPVVKAGGQATLTGAVNNKRAGQTVTIVQLPFGQTTKQVIATLQTGANGAFSFNVTPQTTTTYQAQWRGAESSVSVQVQPLIKLPFVSKSGYFHFYVQAGQSFAGRFVYLQRFTLNHTWVNLAKLQLGQQSGRIIGMRAVRKLIPRGRWSIRVYMPATEMPAGFIDSWSGTQPVLKKR
jgi:plastocyanin